jgi:hypothetical protein
VEKILILLIFRADERTVKYCGAPAATVRQIRRESRQRKEGSPLSIPGKKRPRKYERNVTVVDFDLCVTKRTVTDFYDEKKVVPTCKKCVRVIREKIIFSWEEQSLRKVQVYNLLSEILKTEKLRKPKVFSWRSTPT